MPATMMHVLAGHTLRPNGSDSFFLGCILPDCVDAHRELKDHLHFRDVPAEERLPALIRFGHGLDLTRDFDLGVLLHFYLDYLWDNGPQADHRRSYKGDLWFRDYRQELSKAGNRGATRMPWAAPLWARLRAPDPSLYENTLSLPEDEIQSFLEFNYNFHTGVSLPESPVFTDALVDSFTLDAVEKFRGFMALHFPDAHLS
ncbi:MAG: hypothetical protein IKJ74_05275 [Clostridia bacterium]|nr:hypothetical protein [Clostridia bacterium]